MKTHHFVSHTPEEQRRLSNLGHWIEGLLLAIVGILALLRNRPNFAWYGTAWPVVLMVTGIFLLVMIYPRHPIEDWPAIWNDPQQHQHTLMAMGVTLAGVAELIGLQIVWPAVTLLIGFLFLTHTQYGWEEAVSRAVFIHRILGFTLIVAGLLRAAELFTAVGVFGYLWPLALLAAAAQLLFYREPEGAFDEYSNHNGHG